MIMINDKTNYKKYRYSHRLLPAILLGKSGSLPQMADVTKGFLI